MDLTDIRENIRNMQDCTFVSGTGAAVTIDCSMLRSMTPQEKQASRDQFDALARQIRAKYAQKIIGRE